MGLASVLLISWSPCLSLSCGYRAVHAGEAPGRLHVVVVRSAVADAIAADEVASGVREELAREGALEAGEGYPRVEIEVLRTDEESEGIRATGAGPRARGTGVGVVARAWVSQAAGVEPERDTGDVEARETIALDMNAGQADARANLFHHADATRAAARRLGHLLAERILGRPVASDGE